MLSEHLISLTSYKRRECSCFFFEAFTKLECLSIFFPLSMRVVSILFAELKSLVGVNALFLFVLVV